MNVHTSQNVVVTDVRMPFWSMVIFMVKWAIAAIPAMLILATVGALCFALFTGLAMTKKVGWREDIAEAERISEPVVTNLPKFAARCAGSY